MYSNLCHIVADHIGSAVCFTICLSFKSAKQEEEAGVFWFFFWPFPEMRCGPNSNTLGCIVSVFGGPRIDASTLHRIIPDLLLPLQLIGTRQIGIDPPHLPMGYSLSVLDSLLPVVSLLGTFGVTHMISK